MILSYREEQFSIPHTSKCIIHTTGKISDGDIITITSPVFASINFTSGAINTSDRFDLPVKIINDNGYIINDNTDENLYGTLVCDDNDVFNMYVRIQ
jgi:hypothetical protein